MKCNIIHTPHRSHFTSHIHYAIITAFICCMIFTAYSFFAVLPMAFSKAGAIPVLINGATQLPGFSPALLTLHVDETVVFINHALPARSYTLKADDGSFSSPPIPTGRQWTISFHTPGSHAYHDTASAQTITGELLVVEKNVHLLPTPDPFVEATVTALIRNGQNPPDTIIIATHKHSTTQSNSLLLPTILIVGVSISLLLLGVPGFFLYKRHRKRVAIAGEDEDEDMDEDEDDEDD